MSRTVKIKIRRVNGAAKSEELIDIQKHCLPDDKPLDPAFGDWWIAYAGSEVVGFCCLKPSSRFSDVAYFARAGVHRDYRGRGLQKRLIKVREARARERGFNWMTSDTTLNPASSNNLVACGFKLFLPQKPWGPKKAIYFKKYIGQ